jgi:hypothetical protein
MEQQLADLIGGPHLSEILMLLCGMLVVRGFTHLLRRR